MTNLETLCPPFADVDRLILASELFGLLTGCHDNGVGMDDPGFEHEGIAEKSRWLKSHSIFMQINTIQIKRKYGNPKINISFWFEVICYSICSSLNILLLSIAAALSEAVPCLIHVIGDRVGKDQVSARESSDLFPDLSNLSLLTNT